MRSGRRVRSHVFASENRRKSRDVEDAPVGGHRHGYRPRPTRADPEGAPYGEPCGTPLSEHDARLLTESGFTAGPTEATDARVDRGIRMADLVAGSLSIAEARSASASRPLASATYRERSACGHSIPAVTACRSGSIHRR